MISRLIRPFMVEMSAAHPEVSFIQVDKEIFPEAAALYDVKMVPYFVFVAGDKIIAKVKHFTLSLLNSA